MFLQWYKNSFLILYHEISFLFEVGLKTLKGQKYRTLRNVHGRHDQRSETFTFTLQKRKNHRNYR